MHKKRLVSIDRDGDLRGVEGAGYPFFVTALDTYATKVRVFIADTHPGGESLNYIAKSRPTAFHQHKETP